MFKEYEVTVDLDNDACPFVITNIPVCLRYYDDRLTEDEIKGKPLRILKADQEFWNNLGSGWLDAQISPEIIKALRGEESNWKLVRCIFRKKVAQLWLVNPKTYHRDGYILAEDYADELNTGRTIAYIEPKYGTANWSVGVTRKTKVYRSYDIRLTSSRIVFSEQDNKGYYRCSELDFNDNNTDGRYLMKVKENYF